MPSGVWFGIFGKFHYRGVRWYSGGIKGVGGRPGVWKRIFTHVAIADLWSDGPERQELHGIMKQNINNVRKEKA